MKYTIIFVSKALTTLAHTHTHTHICSIAFFEVFVNLAVEMFASSDLIRH